jgi:hypothetical protein
LRSMLLATSEYFLAQFRTVLAKRSLTCVTQIPRNIY